MWNLREEENTTWQQNGKTHVLASFTMFTNSWPRLAAEDGIKAISWFVNSLLNKYNRDILHTFFCTRISQFCANWAKKKTLSSIKDFNKLMFNSIQGRNVSFS